MTVQTRFILLDSPLMAFIMSAIYCWTRFRQQRSQPFKRDWWQWLTLTGASLGAAMSVKMVGVFAVGTVGIATIVDLWELSAAKRGLNEKQVRKHFFARAACLALLPISIYLASYWVHFAILTRTGPGDAMMSSDFQAGLEGNQMHATARIVHYGQTIRLKSRLEDIYLHSHSHNYPLQHLDGKISSQGQQVVGYPSEDDNNWWQVLPATEDNTKMGQEIEQGGVFRLKHMATGKLLMTHDVASPLTRTNMEITAVDPNDQEKAGACLWRFEIKAGPLELTTKASQFRIMHQQHNVALTNQMEALPDWGFGLREVNGDKRGSDENSLWSVWDVKEPLSAAELAMRAERKPVKMNFWQKWWELQMVSIRANAKLIDNHPFKSEPISWPFVLRGISFWDKSQQARIYLLGNPVAWYLALFGLCLFIIKALRDIYWEHRAVDLYPGQLQQHRHVYRGAFLLLGWALHYLPFFTMSRTLYVHHYLPAYLFSCMVTATMIDHLEQRMKRPQLYRYLIYALIGAVVVSFWYLSEITYGTYVPTSALQHKKLLSSWDWP